MHLDVRPPAEESDPPPRCKSFTRPDVKVVPILIAGVLLLDAMLVNPPDL